MKTTIHAQPHHTCDDLQKLMEDAATAKWLRETRQPSPNPAMRGYVNLSGATIHQIHLHNAPYLPVERNQQSE